MSLKQRDVADQVIALVSSINDATPEEIVAGLSMASTIVCFVHSVEPELSLKTLFDQQLQFLEHLRQQNQVPKEEAVQ